jgi:hypothetical protein
VVTRLEQNAPPGASLVVIEPPPPSLRIGLNHNLVRTPLERAAILEWRAGDGAAYFAYRPVRERNVIAALGTTPEVLVRTAVLVLVPPCDLKRPSILVKKQVELRPESADNKEGPRCTRGHAWRGSRGEFALGPAQVDPR